MNGTTRTISALAALLALGGFAGGCGPGGGDRLPPNVVLIIVDTLRADGLGAYGLPLDTSPELDRFAREGVRFRHALAQCTWTRPSHGAMLTAVHPRTLGMYTEGDEVVAPRFVTLAERFKAAGYATFGATANPHVNSHYGFAQGFDRYLDTDVVFERMPVLDGQTVKSVDDAQFPPARDLFSRLVDMARDGDGPPYYVQVNVMEVHEYEEPGVVPTEFERLFAEVGDERRRRYLQAVRTVSHEIGRFVDELTRMPGWERTLFAITSDHGETFADHPDLADPKWHGWLVYGSQSRVPWILYGTDGTAVPRGVEVEGQVRLLDVGPTLLDLAGLPVPAPDEVPGRSVARLIDDPAADVGLPPAIVVETRFRDANKIAAYTTGWEYVENRDGHAGTDPRELHRVGTMENGTRTNLSSRRPDAATQLSGYLASWEAEHPPLPPTPGAGPVPDEVLEQLRSLGYVQ